MEKDDRRAKAVKEGLKLTAMAAGGLAARTLWIAIRTILLFIAVSAVAYRFLVVPRLQNYQKAMQSAADTELRSNVPAAAATPSRYRYHYELTPEQKQKLIDAWPKQLSRVYVVVPGDALQIPGVNEETRQQSSDEGRVVAKDFAKFLWDNSIDASLVNERKQQRYRSHGIQLVVGVPEDGSRAARPPDVELLLALFRAVNIPVGCCASDPAVPEGGVGISIGGPY